MCNPCPRTAVHHVSGPYIGGGGGVIADGGGEQRDRSLRFQIMICNLQTLRLGLTPSVADYRDTSPETGEEQERVILFEPERP